MNSAVFWGEVAQAALNYIVVSTISNMNAKQTVSDVKTDLRTTKEDLMQELKDSRENLIEQIKNSTTEELNVLTKGDNQSG